MPSRYTRHNIPYLCRANSAVRCCLSCLAVVSRCGLLSGAFGLTTTYFNRTKLQTMLNEMFAMFQYRRIGVCVFKLVMEVILGELDSSRPFVRSFVQPSVRPSVCPTVGPSVCPTVRQSIGSSVRPSCSVRPSVRPSVEV